MTEVTSDRDPVEVLAEEFVERHRRGERPALSEYTRRFPEHADAIRTLFPALIKIEQLKPAAVDATGAFTPAAENLRLQQLGDFRILREVGRGGMGIVYEAEQISLGRHVALKVLPRHAHLDPRQLQRFEREARAAARLHHTNIVPVHGIGVHDGLHYFVMQFIQGLALDVVMAELKALRQVKSNTRVGAPTRLESPPLSAAAHGLLTGRFTLAERAPQEAAAAACPPCIIPDPAPEAAAAPSDSSTIHLPGQPESSLSESGRAYWQSVAHIGIQVAEALAYAGNQGVLHRDIKPANLLLDAQGTVWVTDFGLAKAEADPDNLTHTGDIVGTVRYMAPERFAGKGDLRGDIYSLGLTLYELATLQPAFDAHDRHQLIDRVLREDPLPPRKLHPAVPRDLETIILKAIARDPAQRYATATALAEDLKRFVEDRPILARRASRRERLWRWCRRNPVIAGLSASVAMLLLLVSAISSVSAFWLQQELTRVATAERAEKEASRDALDKLCRSYLAEANARRLSGRAGQRFESLAALRKAVTLAKDLDLPQERFDELRNAAIACLALPDVEVVREWDGWPDGSDFIDLDARLEHYARSDAHGNVSVRRVADDAEIARIPGDGKRVGVRLSRDARYAAVYFTFCGPTQPLTVWKLGPNPAVVVNEPDNHLDIFHFNPAGDQIIFALADGTLRLCNLDGDRAVQQWKTPMLTSVVFDPSGTRVAGSAPGRIVLFDVKDGKAHKELPCPTGWVRAWDPEGQRIAVTHDNKKIYIVDVTGRAKTLVLDGHTTFGTVCSFHPHDEFLLSNDWDNVLRLWDLRTGRQVLHTPHHALGAPRLAPDGETLTPRLDGQKLQLVRLATGSALRTLVLDPARAEGGLIGALVADDRLLIMATGDAGGRKGVAFADLHRGRMLHAIAQPYAYPLRYDERGLLTFGHGVLHWPLCKHPGQPGLYQFGEPQIVTPMIVADHAGVSRDGNVLALPRYHDSGVLLHRDRPAAPVPLAPQSDVRFADVSPDAQWVAMGSFNTQAAPITIWDGRTDERIVDLPIHTGAVPRFSPSGRYLATMGLRLRLWKTGTWQEGPRISGAIGAFAPDDMLAVGDNYGVVRLVDPDSGREYARLETAEQTHMHPQCFTSDGAQLVLRGRESFAMHIWDLRAVRAELKAMGLDWDRPEYEPARPAEPRIIEVRTAAPPARKVEAQRLIGAASQQARKEPASAIASLRSALSLDPQSAPACNQLAWLLVVGPAELRNPAEAVLLARQAVALAPDEHMHHNTLGVALYRNGQPKEAIVSLETSLKGSAGNADAFDLFFLAMCHHRLGSAAAARDSFDQAVRWMEGRPTPLGERWRQELNAFRAEAAELLKGK